MCFGRQERPGKVATVCPSVHDNINDGYECVSGSRGRVVKAMD